MLTPKSGVIKHSGISDYNLCTEAHARAVNRGGSLKFNQDNGLISKINKCRTKLQLLDHGGYDYGRLVATLAKTK